MTRVAPRRPLRRSVIAGLSMLLLAAPPPHALAGPDAMLDLLSRKPISEAGVPIAGPALAPAPAPVAGQTYTVRPGDSLYAILGRLGVTREQRGAYIRELKELNPKITDIDHLPHGRTLRLPDPEKREDAPPPVVPARVAPARVVPAPFSIPAPREHTPPAVRPSVEPLRLLTEAFTGLGEQVHTSGDLYLPMAATGSMKLDGSRFPSIDLSNGTTIIFDTADMFPADYEKRVEANWPGYHLVDLRPGDDPQAMLDRALQLSGYLSVERGRRLLLGKGARISLTADWLVRKEAGTGRTYAINLVADGMSGIPLLLRDYLARFDIIAVNLPGIGDEAPAGGFPPPENLASLPHESFVAAVADIFGIPFERNRMLSIPSDIPKGTAAVNIPFVLSLPRQDVLVSFSAIGERVTAWIKSQGMSLVSFPPGTSRQRFVASVLELAGRPHMTPEIDITRQGGGAGKAVTLSLPGILVTQNGTGLLFTNELPEGEVLAYLASRGIGVVVY